MFRSLAVIILFLKQYEGVASSSLFLRTCLLSFFFIIGNPVFLRPQPVFYTFLGHSTSINCYSPIKNSDIIEYQWTLNGSKPTNVIVENNMKPLLGFSALKIVNTPKSFNGSVFRCKILFSNLTSITSYPSILYIQGVNAVVFFLNHSMTCCSEKNAHKFYTLYLPFNCALGVLHPIQKIHLVKADRLSVSWESPFSYDLIDFNPDYTFCLLVNVSSTSCNSRRVHSVCNLTSTMYHYEPMLIHYCFMFSITLIASNFVGNSSPSTESIAQCTGEF